MVYAVAFSPDGKTILTGSDGQDSAALGRGHRVNHLWHAFTHRDRVRAVAFSPDGKTVLTGSDDDDKTARLWDAATASPLDILCSTKARSLPWRSAPTARPS